MTVKHDPPFKCLMKFEAGNSTDIPVDWESSVAGRKTCPNMLSTNDSLTWSNTTDHFCTAVQCNALNVSYAGFDVQANVTDSPEECSCACYKLPGCYFWLWAGKILN